MFQDSIQQWIITDLVLWCMVYVELRTENSTLCVIMVTRVFLTNSVARCGFFLFSFRLQVSSIRCATSLPKSLLVLVFSELVAVKEIWNITYKNVLLNIKDFFIMDNILSIVL